MADRAFGLKAVTAPATIASWAEGREKERRKRWKLCFVFFPLSGALKAIRGFTLHCTQACSIPCGEKWQKNHTHRRFPPFIAYIAVYIGARVSCTAASIYCTTDYIYILPTSISTQKIRLWKPQSVKKSFFIKSKHIKQIGWWFPNLSILISTQFPLWRPPNPPLTQV